MSKQIAAQLVVHCLEAHGVEYIFGIPGAKIDAVFDALQDSSIKLILCRHEQNAAFMAAAYGRLTGKPGVVLVTSGPGVSNLATGLLTATTEGDPIVAIGGNVSRKMLLKAAHQNTDNVALMRPVTKSSVEVADASNIPEVIANAFRLACTPMRGACFISLPQDIVNEKTDAAVINPSKKIQYSTALVDTITAAAQLIKQAKFPVLLLGQEASRPENTSVIRALLAKTHMPTTSTFQAAGVVSRDLVGCFAGRVGLFRNQPGDQLLNKADVVLTIGYNCVEYDSEIWNAECKKTIVHVDYMPVSIHQTYQPSLELLGDIAANVEALTKVLPDGMRERHDKNAKSFYEMHQKIIRSTTVSKGHLMHPLHFIHDLRESIDDDTYVACDIGTSYMWMARYFLSYEPHRLLFSNGQQTLGVALPWAMGVNFACPGKKVISISGDGGFLFSAMELENAVRQKQHFVHCVWTDGTYNMVKEQELMKYKRKSGVDFGPVNIEDFARAFGAKGYTLKNPNDFKALLKQAMTEAGPVLIDIPIDYSDNPGLFQTDSGH